MLTIITWLMLYDASGVFPHAQTPSLNLAVAVVLPMSLVVPVLETEQRLLRALLLRRRLPEWLLGSA